MILSQRDPKWSSIKIFDMTIGQVGCTSTVLSECIGTTPDIFVSRMKSVGGFSGNLVIWSKIAEAFPGIQTYRYYGYDNAKVLAFVPQVIVEVPGYTIGGTGKHWVRFMGGQRLHDPWTGTDRSTSEFPNPSGFTIIQGKWIGLPYNQPSTGTTDRQILQKIRVVVDSSDGGDNKVFRIKDILGKVGI